MGAFLILLHGCLLASDALAETHGDREKKEIVARLYADYRRSFPGVGDISPQEALAFGDRDDIVWVDTRTPEEAAVSMLPCAISRREFLERRDEFRTLRIVAYCTIGYRSGLFAGEMAELGIRVLNLEGGILGWTLEGGKVVDAQGETRRLHVYGDEWDYAPSGYETVKFGFVDRLIRNRR
ncbi:MAG: rhodanese-like domain-containing protein [Desulfobacterales bacterium]